MLNRSDLGDMDGLAGLGGQKGKLTGQGGSLELREEGKGMTPSIWLRHYFGDTELEPQEAGKAG